MFRSSRFHKSSSHRGLSVLIPVITFIFGWIGSSAYAPHDSFSAAGMSMQRESTAPVDLDLFWTVWEMLHKDYLDPSKIDSQDAAYGAIEGMVSSLHDPHTVFFDPDATKSYIDSIEGTLEGIGAELMIDEGKLTINGVLKNSPAQRAGLLPKDIIYKIDDTFSSDVTLGEAVDLIRGPKGTSVTLSILRAEESEPLKITVVRETLHIDSVTWEKKEDGIFLISINQFATETTHEFKKAVTDILTQNPKGIILDVRFNPGGYMNGAVDILSEFVEHGIAVKVVDRSGEEALSVSGEASLAHVPLVVLVDGGSASAAEIVAGALQDYKRATLVGTQTYGKGTVQELRNMPKGTTLKITIARWLTPLGRDIDKVGIHPDVVVDFTDEDIAKQNDVQLKKAIEVLGTIITKKQ